MPNLQRPRLPALCLLLLLPHALTLQAADAAAPTAANAAAIERPVIPERSQAEAVALERQLPQTEQQQLTAADEQFLALWKPANAAEPSGVVILIPGDAESADWPRVVGPLRKKLPDAGWHSLSLSLPDPQGDAPPIRLAEAAASPNAVPEAKEPAATTAPVADTNATAAEAPEPSAVAEEQYQAHTARVLARIQAGIAFAQQQKPKAIILLGHGSGAYWAARYLAENHPAEIQNLLLVAAQMPAGFSPALDELVPGLQLATGDFYYKDQTADRTAALQRAQAGKRQQHPAYIQIAMKALPGNPATEQEQLYRRVRGWLSLHPQAAAPRPTIPGAAITPAATTAPGG